MSLGLPERCILPLLMTPIIGKLTIGGILVLCTRQNSARFTEIFRTAPVWLLQFTHIDFDAPVLEFDLPDMSAELIWGMEGVKERKAVASASIGNDGCW